MASVNTDHYISTVTFSAEAYQNENYPASVAIHCVGFASHRLTCRGCAVAARADRCYEDLGMSGDEDYADDVLQAYEDGFYQASHDEIERVARYQVTA